MSAEDSAARAAPRTLPEYPKTADAIKLIDAVGAALRVPRGATHLSLLLTNRAVAGWRCTALGNLVAGVRVEGLVWAHDT